MPITWGFILSTLLIIVAVQGMISFITKNSFKTSDKNLEEQLIYLGYPMMWKDVEY